MEKFIKACVSILPKGMQKIYYKYEEQMMYIVFGGLTTLISMITKIIPFWLIPGKPTQFQLNAVLTFSWICAVTFAFFTNKKYVFKNETKNAKDFWKVFFSFFGSRLATLLMEYAIFWVLCTRMEKDESIVTLINQVIIFIANYVLSKIFVFRKKDKQEQGIDTENEE